MNQQGPARVTGRRIPARTVQQQAPARGTARRVPARTVEQHAPARVTGRRAPARTTGEQVPAPVADQPIALVDLLDRVLAGGVVVTGEITLSIADVDLVHISLRTLLSSVSALRAGDE
ncbi:hypothetical protein FB470_004511 [Amycolatopsis thermophila]|uniref:Gas vesicle protein n=1 Tax=Amycolatopsis thermophila TaxID=206084 RepID=A0ABU0EYY4_9PSEU|nr:hypothetical protein [Amycolatopsis thermophila]